MKKIFEIYKRYEEIIRYLVIGVCTTIVSLVSYYILITFMFDAKNALELQITNIISWILSVSFAFFANKNFVFKTKCKNTIFEATKFFESRLLTLLIDVLSMFLMVTILKFNDKVAKICVQFIILILNYLFSKFIVFKKDEE